MYGGFLGGGGLISAVIILQNYNNDHITFTELFLPMSSNFFLFNGYRPLCPHEHIIKLPLISAANAINA